MLVKAVFDSVQDIIPTICLQQTQFRPPASRILHELRQYPEYRLPLQTYLVTLSQRQGSVEDISKHHGIESGVAYEMCTDGSGNGLPTQYMHHCLGCIYQPQEFL